MKRLFKNMQSDCSSSQTVYIGEVGKAIALARVNLKLTQKALANRIGLSPSALSRIEKVKRNVSFKTFEKIAHGLGLKASQLIIVAESIRDMNNAMKQLGRDIVLAAQPLLASSLKRSNKGRRKVRSTKRKIKVH
jgi:transcriptional regulator with XRE-family HTH domain